MKKLINALKGNTAKTSIKTKKWGKPPEMLLGDMEASLKYAMSYTEPNRVGKFPIHVSSLLKEDFCLREYHLAKDLDLVASSSVNASLNLLFKTGELHEEIIVDALRRSYGDNAFYGRWSCSCGAIQIEESFGKPEKFSQKCTVCNTHAHNKYHQVALKSTHVVGRPDIIMLDPKNKNKLSIVEVKSVNKEKYETVTKTRRPFFDALRQGMLYHTLLKSRSLEMSDNMYYVYSQREGNPFTFNIKVLPMVHTDIESLHHSFVTDRLKALEIYASSEQAHDRACSSRQVGELRKCPVVDRCFTVSLTSSAGFEYIEDLD